MVRSVYNSPTPTTLLRLLLLQSAKAKANHLLTLSRWWCWWWYQRKHPNRLIDSTLTNLVRVVDRTIVDANYYEKHPVVSIEHHDVAVTVTVSGTVSSARTAVAVAVVVDGAHRYHRRSC
jgi:hypothetical protein